MRASQPVSASSTESLRNLTRGSVRDSRPAEVCDEWAIGYSTSFMVEQRFCRYMHLFPRLDFFFDPVQWCREPLDEDAVFHPEDLTSVDR